MSDESLAPFVLTTEISGSGPAVLLVPAAGASIEDSFDPLTPLLAKTRTVVAPEYPGCAGAPGADRPLTLDALADSYVAAAVAAGQDSFTIVGHSLGAAVAVRAAVRHPERVKGLVLTAGFAKPDHRLRILTEMTRDCLVRRDFRGYARIMVVTCVGESLVNQLPTGEIYRALGEVAELVWPGAEEQFALVQSVDITEDLAGIDVPTLVIATMEDTFVSPANSRFLADAIPGAEYAEIEAGHLLNIAHTDPWNELIAKFFMEHGI
ncbi:MULTISPECIES: alpha/beta fold hydrolase [unclassified Streptomyces]|uniref:alpha/beta fold hydrolase n=1 Tax=unclassified Streptomyces TaxID=2593676 RepID=UPI00381F259B